MKRAMIYILFTILIISGLFMLPKIWKKTPQKDIMSTKQEASFDKSLTLEVKFSDCVREMSLYDYLIGVVAAEMPESFPQEAQKAQAIAARTFTLKNTHKHPDADICASSACCQGFTESANSVAVNAVTQTDGLVITFDNKLIDATYFSCCASRTEAAVAVWGSEIPYLQSVESPDQSDSYTQSVTYSTAAFFQKLNTHFPEMDPADHTLGKISYTKGGGIDTVILGGTEITGTALRSIFDLRSTEIDILVGAESITLTTYGFGHRVGMSQHGAKALAEQGHDFKSILRHYYQNIELQRLCTKKTPPPESEEA